MATMGRSLINLETHLSSMLKLSSKAAKVARLLALKDVAEVMTLMESLRDKEAAAKEKEGTPMAKAIEEEKAAAKLAAVEVKLKEALAKPAAEAEADEANEASSMLEEKPPSPSKVQVDKKLHGNAEDASSDGTDGI